MLSRSIIVSTLGLLAIAVAGPATALEPSGTAVAVVRDTGASGPGGDRALDVKGPVFAGDLIRTDRRGSAQLLFADSTKMVIGPNSEVKLDKFVFSGPSQASAFAIGAVRGSFRFITGASAKNAYSIDTPTATIGVRGTGFDGFVAEDGTTTIMMWHGTARICDRAQPRRHCAEVSGSCTTIQIDPRQQFNWVNDVYARTALLDDNVPFTFRQARLNREFRVSSEGCAIRNLDPQPDLDGENPPPQRERPSSD